jgi:tetratricopeptide (TPR) repeat protein
MTAMGVGELKGLADTLMEDHAVSHKLESIEQAIAIYEEVLRFRPAGHEQRAEAVSDLGDALFHFCHFNGTDETRGHRSIELLREAVRLRPPRHPSRDCSLHMLARALFFIGYEQHSGGLTALTECILLNREALQLRMPGHLERSKSLSNLAAVLLRSFELCGHPDLIAECILVNREALQLEEPGHPHRGATLNNLAIALDDLVAFQGGPEALAKAISLHREALDLRPVGHPRRYSTLDNLANSLTKSFDLHTLPVALSEAIALRREACVLLPDGHPQWATLLSNLADSLITDFRYRRDLCSITEAIALLRRASLLRPSADHIHDTLAEALLAQFIACRDPELLPEAITLRRKVLLMRPHEHTQRPHSLQRLGSLLCQPESQSWSEALALFHEALETCPAGYPGRSLLLSDLSRCYLTPKSPSFDLARGISYLTEGYSDEFSHVNQRLGHAVSDLQQVEVACSEAMRDADASIKNHYSGQVLELHAKVIGILPRAANLGLDHKTRLQVITGSDEIGRNAAARALNLGRTSQAVELLEAGRGIFWSQTLHLRATGFDGIPDSDRENLLRLFRMLEHGARSAESSEQTVEEHEQALARRRLLNKEAEALISRIRDYPGCARFLLPAAFDSLVNGLPDGFVVVLNASKLGHHALLLHKTDEVAVSLELSPPSMGFDFAALRAQLPRDMSDVDPEQQDDIHSRAMRMDSGRVSSLEHVLLQLWTTMARPVVRKLGLKVSNKTIACS